ncbi:chaperonin 10-like protein [Thamnidium elegans]|nr:chaperonin 10-like protein [Thamnidium elegans]
MSTENNTFTAWAGIKKGNPFEKVVLNLKQWDEDSLEMNITRCGICGSDIHTLEEEWGTPGHEIVGIVSRIGSNVRNLKVGYRVCVGAQSTSCHQCEFCLNSQENMCQGSNWPNGDRAFGGGDYRFVYRVPDSMSSVVAASFFCAGVTAYVPLKCSNIIPNKSVVGVMGIGGLNHYGIQFAKAFGAKVIGILYSEVKRDITFRIGCDEYLNCSDKDAISKHQNQLTHILCIGTSSGKKYLSLLRFNGYFMNVEEMLLFAEKNNIVTWTTTYKMSNVNKALKDFKAGKARFRFVLEKQEYFLMIK